MLVQSLKLPEKLAKTHLRIEFLISCRKSSLRPRFIQDALKPINSIFSSLKNFYSRRDQFATYLLNGSISKTFQEKAYLERSQRRLYEQLCALNLNLDVFNWVNGTCRAIFASTIAEIRPRLERKFYELKRRNQGEEPQVLEDNGRRQRKEAASLAQDAGIKRVNNISSTPLDENTEQLLSYGPKFSITPSVNKKLIRDVERSFERFAYGKRWADKIKSDREERNRRAPHIGTSGEDNPITENGRNETETEDAGSPVTQSSGQLLSDVRFPDTNKRQPPPSDRDTEDRLAQLKSSVVKIYKGHKSDSKNVSKEQQNALKGLRDNVNLIVKPSDKCEGFVILNKADYVERPNTYSMIRRTTSD